MCLLCKAGITGQTEHWSGNYTTYFVIFTIEKDLNQIHILCRVASDYMMSC